MSRLLGSLLAFGVAWLIGYLLVACVWRHRSRDVADRLMHWTAGFGLGVGVVAALDFLWIAALGRASGGIVVLDLAVLAGLALVRRATRPRPALAAEAPAAFGWAAGSVFALFTLIALGIVGVLLLRVPDGIWDALAIWNVHAKFFNAPSLHGWKAVFDPVMLASHPDYPPLLPAFVARGWMYAGQSIPLVPMAMAFAFTLALLVLITSAVAGAVGASLGALACAMLAASPIFLGTAFSQYADMPLAFFFLLSIALVHRADAEPEPRAGLYLLAGLAAGMAALTKNEGSFFIVALGLGRGVHLLLAGKVRTELKSLAWLLGGMAPALGVLCLYKSYAPPNYLVSGQGSNFWGQLFSRPRAQLILAELGKELERPHDLFVGYVQRIPAWNWHLLAASLFILLFGLERRRLTRPLSKWGLLLGVLGMLADLVTTRLTRGSFGWHWPVLIAVVSLIVGLGFDLRRLRHPSFLAATTTLVVVNAGYFVVYLLTPLDLRWQLSASLERLLLHTMPLAIFIAFLTLAPWGHPRAGGAWV